MLPIPRIVRQESVSLSDMIYTRTCNNNCLVTANERENETTPNSILYSPEGPEGLQYSAQEFNTQYDLEKVEITCIPYQWKIHFPRLREL